MYEWKKPLFIGIGWGLGTAVGLALLVGGFLGYQGRPKPPKPPKQWNTAAIKADYDRPGTEGDKNSIVFYSRVPSSRPLCGGFDLPLVFIDPRLREPIELV